MKKDVRKFGTPLIKTVLEICEAAGRGDAIKVMDDFKFASQTNL